jgi:hypothetical protein
VPLWLPESGRSFMEAERPVRRLQSLLGSA